MPFPFFFFVRELELLLKNNLIKGGDLDNAIVIYDKTAADQTASGASENIGLRIARCL